MLKKILLGLLALLTLATAVAFYKADDIARWYVHDHFTGVTLKGDITIHWSESRVTFEKVHVTRPGIKAELDRVEVSDRGMTVAIVGGLLDVDLDKLGGGKGEGSGRQITTKQLKVVVHKGNIEARITGTSIDGERVCFDDAEVDIKGHTVKVVTGCMKRDKSEGTAQSVSVVVELPFTVPRMKRKQELVLTGVQYGPNDHPSLFFDKATIGPFTFEDGAAILGDDQFAHHFEFGSIKANHPWIAPYPVTFAYTRLWVPDSVIRGETGHPDGLDATGSFRNLSFQIGPAHIHIDPHNWIIEGDQPCNNWVEALPQPLPPALEQARGNFTGSLAFRVQAKPTPHLTIDYNCRFKCSAEPIASIRKRQFTYEAYDSDGKLYTRTTGRHTRDWVSLAGLPPHVPDAFRLSEDPGFNHHKGIHVMALQNSLKANLEKGEFVKGGSTISMQVAKNLWLRRHKTVGRKAMEALLTIALESCMTKPQIMELYMNIVEYAPDVYGLEQGTKHHFRKPAAQLQPDEAFFLALLLPNPRKPKTMAWVHKHMGRLATSGYITEYLIPETEGEPQYDTSSWIPVD